MNGFSIIKRYTNIIIVIFQNTFVRKRYRVGGWGWMGGKILNDNLLRDISLRRDSIVNNQNRYAKLAQVRARTAILRRLTVTTLGRLRERATTRLLELVPVAETSRCVGSHEEQDSARPQEYPHQR